MDSVGLAEAAWSSEGDDNQWLSALSRMVGEFVGAEQGVSALRVNARVWRAGDSIEITAMGASELSDLAIGAISALAARPMTVEEQGRLARAGVVASVRRTLGPLFSAPGGFRDGFAAAGIYDSLFVNARDASGVCVTFNMPSAVPIKITRQRRWSLAHVAAHVSSSNRLRTRAASGDTGATAEDAIFDPGGKLLHAERDAKPGDVRSALRDAAVGIDRSRGKMRRSDPDRAIELWPALVSGRWSLVDRFDTDGRRFLVARRNEPDAEVTLALSARESAVVRLAALGHPNKIIAYELGIQTSSVATHLANAMAKLGLCTRVELVKLVEALEISGDHA